MSFRELLHVRNLSVLSVAEINLATQTNCKVGFHLICIPTYTEIIGLHLSAKGSSYSDALPPAGTVARMWLMTRNVQTYLPDFIIPESDTKLGISNPVIVGNDSDLKINSACAGGDYSIDFFYPNPIVISQPDYIYVGIAIQSEGGGRFRASFTENNPMGIADLEYTHTVPANANILTWTIPEQIPYSHLQISSTAVLANLNVSLITQGSAPNIPYLIPVRLP